MAVKAVMVKNKICCGIENAVYGSFSSLSVLSLSQVLSALGVLWRLCLVTSSSVSMTVSSNPMIQESSGFILIK